MKKNLIGIGLIAIGIFGIWVWFFKLIPQLDNMMPVCGWKRLIEVAIYILVGYFGGIALSLFLMVIGVAILFFGGEKQ